MNVKYSWMSLAFFSAFSVHAANPFYLDKERGWFWHEDPVVEPVEEIEPEVPTSASAPQAETEVVELDAAWIKANIEKLMLKAMNEPTPEHLASWAYANRLMLDMGSRFSSKMTEFMLLEDTLNETNRRPMSQFSINSFKGEQRVSIRDVFNTVKQSSGIWFFFSSTCGYCKQQVPILTQLHAQYGIDILAISMDGGVLPGMEKFEVVMDYNLAMSDRFGVASTPSLFMVDSKNNDVIAIAEGVLSLPEIEEKIMLLAKDRGIVSDEEYMLTRGVREINVFKNDNGQIVAEKKKLESDPGYLADLLREKLKDMKPYGAVSVENGVEKNGAN